MSATTDKFPSSPMSDGADSSPRTPSRPGRAVQTPTIGLASQRSRRTITKTERFQLDPILPTRKSRRSSDPGTSIKKIKGSQIRKKDTRLSSQKAKAKSTTKSPSRPSRRKKIEVIAIPTTIVSPKQKRSLEVMEASEQPTLEQPEVASRPTKRPRKSRPAVPIIEAQIPSQSSYKDLLNEMSTPESPYPGSPQRLPSVTQVCAI
ncbi:hypothetical protein DFS34DRAFT_609874, partial [Phlyctochytrium arcticum]